MRHLAALLVSALIALPAHAQTFESGTKPSPSADDRRWDGGYGYFMIGGLYSPTFDALNEQLTAASHPTIGAGFTTVGGGGHWRLDWLVLGGEGFAMAGTSVDRVGSDLDFVGGGGFATAGVVVYSDERFELYPTLSVGGGGFSLNLVEDQSTTFAEALDAPGQGLSTGTGGWIGQLAVTLHYILVTEETSSSRAGWLFGVRAGYAWSPKFGNWHLEDGSVLSGGPRIHLNGPFIRLLIGGGGVESS